MQAASQFVHQERAIENTENVSKYFIVREADSLDIIIRYVFLVCFIVELSWFVLISA